MHHHELKNLIGQGAHGRGSLGGVGSIEGKTKILQERQRALIPFCTHSCPPANQAHHLPPPHLAHECRAEATLVFVAGWDLLHHSGTGVVRVTAPAATTGHVDHICQLLGVKPQAEEGEGEEERGGAQIISF